MTEIAVGETIETEATFNQTESSEVEPVKEVVEEELENVAWDFLSIACKLLYEVEEASLLVRSDLEEDSELVVDEPLPVGTRLHALVMRQLDEENIGVFTALEHSDKPLGWITFIVGSTCMRLISREMHEVISPRPALVRTGVALNSPEVGRLPVGTRVLVLQAIEDSDGSRRACVAMEGYGSPLGWMTHRTRDGTCNLRVASQNSADVEEPIDIEQEGDQIPVITPVKIVRSQPKKKKSESPSSGALAQRAASSGLPTGLMTASEIRQVLEAQTKKYQEEVERAAHKSLRELLGEALASREMKVSALVREWAKRGVEPISKMEFRAHVRKVLNKVSVSTKDVDQLFESLDDDHGGSLDVEELTAALKELQTNAAAAAHAREQSSVGIEAERKKVEQVQEYLDRTEDYERAKAEFEAESQRRRLDAEVGQVLLLRKTKISELAAKWTDPERDDGRIGQYGFRLHVLELGITPEPSHEDIAELYNELDLDGDGSLDQEELQEALKTLQDAAAAVASEIDRLKEKAQQLGNIAKACQGDLKKLLEEEEAIAQAKAKAEAEAEEARVLAEKEAKARKLAEAEAIRRKKAEEKAAHDARIEAKRKGQRPVRP